MKDATTFIISGFIVFIGVFIVLLGWLHLLGWSYSGNEILIAAAIGLIGAIISGTISGLLTLFGVKLTIKENHEKDFNESLPKRIMYAEDIIYILEKQLILLKKSSGKEPGKELLLRQRLLYIVEYLEKDGLLMNSSEINLTTYRATRFLYNYLKDVLTVNSLDSMQYSEIIDHMNSCIDVIENERDNFLKKANIYK